MDNQVYTAADPMEMLRNMKAFALKLKHHLHRSTERNLTEALELAFSSAHLPSRRTDSSQHTAVNKGAPQIHFLTSGPPVGRASQVLDKIDEFDKGRNIPIHSIAFTSHADLATKEFVKNLARKTGGFFRSIEQASRGAKKRKREQSDVSMTPTESPLH